MMLKFTKNKILLLNVDLIILIIVDAHAASTLLHIHKALGTLTLELATYFCMTVSVFKPLICI